MAKGKKKQFIDRKNASTYHLMHRSQRDVGGDILEEGDVSGSAMVLWPSPNNNPTTDQLVLLGSDGNKMREWRQKLSNAGLLDVDHERYLKPITGTGTFLCAPGAALSSARLEPREEALMEVDRQFDSIPLTAECMDDDIAEALFDFEEGDFEEILDDFVLTAAQEPQEDEKEEFDYDAHIRNLMEKARREREDAPGVDARYHDWGRKDKDFFSKLRPVHEDDDDSLFGGTVQTTPGVVPALSPEEERALCEKFEETLIEYDSDEVGDNPEAEIHGERALDDQQLEAALDDFLHEKEDEIFMMGAKHHGAERAKGGSGFSALVGRQMVHAKHIDEITYDEAPPPIEEVLAGANEILAQRPERPPAEDVLIDGKSYYTERVRNPFDCESILSTYSNLDNNPVTIEAGRRRRKKKTSVLPVEEGGDESVKQIRLSAKTGLPLGVLPTRPSRNEFEEDTFVSVNRGVARKKTESKEEKRERKQSVKRERHMARIQKKVAKEVFREELEKRAVDVLDDVAGKTVFRYA